MSFFHFPFFYNPYYFNRFKQPPLHYSPRASSNKEESLNNQADSVFKLTDPPQNNSKGDSEDNFFFEIFGLKLQFDDTLLIILIFFLYKEGVEDEELFIVLILLLLS